MPAAVPILVGVGVYSGAATTIGMAIGLTGTLATAAGAGVIASGTALAMGAKPSEALKVGIVTGLTAGIGPSIGTDVFGLAAGSAAAAAAGAAAISAGTQLVFTGKIDPLQLALSAGTAYVGTSVGLTQGDIAYEAARLADMGVGSGAIAQNLSAMGVNSITANVAANLAASGVSAAVAPALTAGIINGGLSGLRAVATGGDLDKALGQGFLIGSAGELSSTIVDDLIGKDNVKSLANRFKLTEDQVRNISISSISNGLSAEITKTGDFFNVFGESLVAQGASQAAANQITKALSDRVSAKGMAAIVSATNDVIDVGVRAGVRGQDITTALETALPTITTRAAFVAAKTKEPPPPVKTTQVQTPQDITKQLQEGLIFDGRRFANAQEAAQEAWRNGYNTVYYDGRAYTLSGSFAPQPKTGVEQERIVGTPDGSGFKTKEEAMTWAKSLGEKTVQWGGETWKEAPNNRVTGIPDGSGLKSSDEAIRWANSLGENQVLWNGTIYQNKTLTQTFEEINNQSTFGAAYNLARDKLGPGVIFDWKGNKYTTDTREENPSLARASDIVRNRTEAKDVAAAIEANPTAALNLKDDKDSGGVFEYVNQKFFNNAFSPSNIKDVPVIGNVFKAIANMQGLGLDAVGNFLKDISTGVALGTDTSFENVGTRAADSLINLGKGLGSDQIKTNIDSYLRNYTAKANEPRPDGLGKSNFDKVKDAYSIAKENPLGAFGAVFYEIGQEAPGLLAGASVIAFAPATIPLGIGFVTATTAGATVSSVINALEIYGNIGKEQYDYEIKQGKPHSQALEIANQRATVSSLITMGTEYVADKTIYDAFSSGLIKGAAGTVFTGARAVAANYFGEYAESMAHSIYLAKSQGQEITTDKLNQFTTQANIEALIGKSVAAAFVAPSTVIALATDGSNITLEEVQNRTNKPIASLNYDAPIFKTSSGDVVTLGGQIEMLQTSGVSVPFVVPTESVVYVSSDGTAITSATAKSIATTVNQSIPELFGYLSNGTLDVTNFITTVTDKTVIDAATGKIIDQPVASTPTETIDPNRARNLLDFETKQKQLSDSISSLRDTQVDIYKNVKTLENQRDKLVADYKKAYSEYENHLETYNTVRNLGLSYRMAANAPSPADYDYAVTRINDLVPYLKTLNDKFDKVEAEIKSEVDRFNVLTNTIETASIGYNQNYKDFAASFKTTDAAPTGEPSKVETTVDVSRSQILQLAAIANDETKARSGQQSFTTTSELSFTAPETRPDFDPAAFIFGQDLSNLQDVRKNLVGQAASLQADKSRIEKAKNDATVYFDSLRPEIQQALRSDYNAQITGFDNQIARLDGQIKTAGDTIADLDAEISAGESYIKDITAAAEAKRGFGATSELRFTDEDRVTFDPEEYVFGAEDFTPFETQKKGFEDQIASIDSDINRIKEQKRLATEYYDSLSPDIKRSLAGEYEKQQNEFDSQIGRLDQERATAVAAVDSVGQTIADKQTYVTEIANQRQTIIDRAKAERDLRDEQKYQSEKLLQDRMLGDLQNRALEAQDVANRSEARQNFLKNQLVTLQASGQLTPSRANQINLEIANLQSRAQTNKNAVANATLLTQALVPAQKADPNRTLTQADVAALTNVDPEIARKLAIDPSSNTAVSSSVPPNVPTDPNVDPTINPNVDPSVDPVTAVTPGVNVDLPIDDIINRLLKEGVEESLAVELALEEVKEKVPQKRAVRKIPSSQDIDFSSSGEDQTLYDEAYLFTGPSEERFVSPLEPFTESTQLTPPRQEQKREEEKMQYFNYGQPTEIDQILEPFTTTEPFAGPFAMQANAFPQFNLPRFGMKAGGPLTLAAGKIRRDYREGDMVEGPGDGQSDDIPAMLADGEFVIPADVVAALGNGSNKAGAEKLYQMMHNIRREHRKGKPEDLPAPAKSPLQYIRRAS